MLSRPKSTHAFLLLFIIIFILFTRFENGSDFSFNFFLLSFFLVPFLRSFFVDFFFLTYLIHLHYLRPMELYNPDLCKPPFEILVTSSICIAQYLKYFPLAEISLRPIPNRVHQTIVLLHISFLICPSSFPILASSCPHKVFKQSYLQKINIKNIVY